MQNDEFDGGTHSAKRIRIGMLTPSSNTMLEPYTNHMLAPLFPRLSAHYSRFRVTEIALDDRADGQFALDPILAAADLLSDAKCDVIAWNGTSASWRGFETDRRLCTRIEATTGIPATSAILSLNDILAERSVSRLGLVTPYTDDVQARIIANYASIGVEIVAEEHCGLRDNFSFAEVSPRRIGAMCEAVADAKPHATAIVCTNLQGPLIAAEVERRSGIPTLDSIAFTLRGCLVRLGVDLSPLERFGSVFSTPANGASPLPSDEPTRPDQQIPG